MLQLYPELQGSQEFHPWKSSLSFSLWKILQALSSSQLLFTHTSTFTQSYIRRQTQYSTQFCLLFRLPPLPPPPNPSHPHVALSGPVPTANTAFPGAGRPDQVSSTGVAGVIAWRKWPRPECMAADTTRHVASESLTLALSLFFLSVSPPLFTFIHSIILFPLHLFLPPVLLLPPHALLCEGIEFISEHWAGHTTTINSLSASLAHTHSKVKLLTTLCQMNQTNPPCPFVSYKVHLSGKYWKK